MGFRINRGIFQFKDAATETYINKFKIDDRDGALVEVDADGNAVTGYLKVGEKATDSDKVDGYHATNAAGGIPVLNSNGYWNSPNWINVYGHGLYSSSMNGAHFYPNNKTYGSWKILGTKGGWYGLHFGENSGVTLMMNESESGIHREGSGWKFRHQGGKFYIHTGTNGGGTGYEAWHKGNLTPISYETSAFFVGGDPRTYYPVLLNKSSRTTGRFVIYRDNVHQDESGRGAGRLVLTGYTSGWGHVPLTLHYETKISGTVLWKFLASNYRTGLMVVYLKGGTTYYYKSEHGFTLHDANGQGEPKSDGRTTWLPTPETEANAAWEGETPSVLTIEHGSNYYDGQVMAGSFKGDGSNVTNVNAQTLDGLDSTQFLRSDASDTMSGDLTISNGRIQVKRGTGLTHVEWEDDSTANGRGQLILDSHYSDLIIASRNSNSNKHGSTLTFATQSTSTNDVAKWVIGQGQYEEGADHLAFAYGVNQTNPHGILGTDNAYADFVIMNGGKVVIGGTVDKNAYSTTPTTRLMFGGANSDAESHYYIGTNKEDYGGNYTKLDLRWHTGIRMGARPQYGGIRIFDDEDLGTRIMSIGETDANVRIDNNLWIGGAGGWITDLLNANATAAANAQTAADTALARANGAREDTVAIGELATAAQAAADAAQATADGKLGATAKAADSNLLDGVDSNRFVYGGNATKTTNISNVSTALASGFYDGYNITGSPTGTWYTYINMRHNNTGNNYGSQIAVSFYSNADMYVRTISNGTYQGWSKIWNSANFNPTDKASTESVAAAQAAADEAINLAREAQTTADGKLGATAKAADADKLDGYDWMQSGKSVRANEFYADNWFRNYNSNEGLYNQATGQHWYSDGDDYWNIAGGTTFNAIRFRDEHNGTQRGLVGADNSNRIGFIDAGGSWAVRHDNDSGTLFYTDNETLEFRVGRDKVTGDYGTVQTDTSRNGWGGYSIYGQYALMSNGSRVGIYNDIDNEWMIQCYRNAQTILYHNGAAKLETTAAGVSVTGTVTATSFSGSGAGLTNLPVVDQTIPVTINGEGNDRIVSINMNLDMGQIEFTLTNGQTFTAMMGR